MSNISDSEVSAPAVHQPRQANSVFGKIQALLSYLRKHSTTAKQFEAHEKPLLRLLDDVVSSLPTSPTPLQLADNKITGQPIVSGSWKSYDSEPLVVVLSGLKPSDKSKNTDREDRTTDSDGAFIREDELRELKIYSSKSHPRRLCFDITFATDPTADLKSPPQPAQPSKAAKKRKRSKAKKRDMDAKAKAEELLVRRCDDGSFTTTVPSATGSGRHTRWHYDS